MRHIVTIIALVAAWAARPTTAQQHQHRQAAPDSAQQAMSQCHAMQMMHGMMTGMSMRDTMEHRLNRMQREGMQNDQFMMNAMRFTPGNILAHEDELDLSENQATAIRELVDQQTMPPRGMAAMQSLHERLRVAFNATPPDTAAIRSAFEQMAAHGAGMHAGHFAAAATARALLTAEQRRQLEALPHPCSMMRQEDDGASGVEHNQHHGN